MYYNSFGEEKPLYDSQTKEANLQNRRVVITLGDKNRVVEAKRFKKYTKRLQTTVNSYRGKKGILYRIFINGKKSMKCMDLVIPYTSKEVSYGRVYTQDEDKLREF